MHFPIELPVPSQKIAEELKINPEDVLENFTRGSGPGGQKVNKTTSVVHLRHIPTGVEVKVGKYREQSKNRLSAWKLLILKIEEHEKGAESKMQKAIFKLRKQKQKRSKRAKEKMLADKRVVGELKERRKGVGNEL